MYLLKIEITCKLFVFVTVAYAQKEFCTGPLEVKAQLGYLSSHIAEQNGCGTLDSPWFVTVELGQQIQFTLLDFGEDEKKLPRTGQVSQQNNNLKSLLGTICSLIYSQCSFTLHCLVFVVTCVVYQIVTTWFITCMWTRNLF